MHGADAECALRGVDDVEEPDAWQKALYPFLSRWDHLLLVRADAACAGPWTLAVSGPRGVARVRFTVD